MAIQHIGDVVRVSGTHVQATCGTCDWRGVLVTIRTIEGWNVAQQHANDHKFTHRDVRDSWTKAYEIDRELRPHLHAV